MLRQSKFEKVKTPGRGWGGGMNNRGVNLDFSMHEKVEDQRALRYFRMRAGHMKDQGTIKGLGLSVLPPNFRDWTRANEWVGHQWSVMLSLKLT
jgi:hypothetical protein